MNRKAFQPPAQVYKFANVEPQQLQAELYSVTLSDSSVDRHGDTIDQAGWKLDTYKANPVLLWAHDASQLPIGKVLNVRVENGALRGEMKFAGHAFAKEVEALVADRTLRAVSVGFAPKKFEIAEERDNGESYFPPLDFKEQELLELSVVPVPANPNALIDAKHKGLNVDLVVEWALKALEHHKGAGRWVPHELAHAARAVEPAKIISLPPAPAPAPAVEDVTPEKAAEMVRTAVAEFERKRRMRLTGKLD